MGQMSTPIDQLPILCPTVPSGNFETRSEGNWLRFFDALSKNGIEIEHPQASAVLLTQVGAGVRWELEKWTRQGKVPPEYKPSPIGIKNPLFEEKEGPEFDYHQLKNIIQISPTSLSIFSQVPPYEIIPIKNPKGYVPDEIIFIGTPADYFLLRGGVEEENHSLWVQKNGKVLSSVDHRSVPRSVYYQQPHEYSALVAQFEAAQELEMPEETIEFLRQEIEAVLCMSVLETNR